jgi:predicted transcriptional regulator of viral defense system
MGRVSAFSIAQEDIEEYFDKLDNKILTIEDLNQIFEDNKRFWRLPKSWHVFKFIEAMEEKTNKFSSLKLTFPYRSFTRYFWKESPFFELALSLNKKAYLSHYSAIYLHELTDQVPKTIYVTIEQPPKDLRGTLKQDAIDRAFSKPQRVSENCTSIDNTQRICLLHGKGTKKTGVVKLESGLKTTNLERTLIDAAVRPLYCGGVSEVMEAYRRAAGKVSVNKLAAMLKKINHIYPYHQAIGFYLERSGAYKQSQIDLLKRFDFEFDFYLTYNMKEKSYSKEWRIYYPEGL